MHPHHAMYQTGTLWVSSVLSVVILNILNHAFPWVPSLVFWRRVTLSDGEHDIPSRPVRGTPNPPYNGLTKALAHLGSVDQVNFTEAGNIKVRNKIVTVTSGSLSTESLVEAYQFLGAKGVVVGIPVDRVSPTPRMYFNIPAVEVNLRHFGIIEQLPVATLYGQPRLDFPLWTALILLPVVFLICAATPLFNKISVS